MTRLNFMLELVDQIIEKFKIEDNRSPKFNRTNYLPVRLQAPHYTRLIEPTGHKIDQKGRCTVCSKNKIK